MAMQGVNAAWWRARRQSPRCQEVPALGVRPSWKTSANMLNPLATRDRHLTAAVDVGWMQTCRNVNGVLVITYLADFAYGATKYPCAWFRPSVYRGRFGDTESQLLQRAVYDRLLRNGFRRTFWQLIFPGQIAGIV